MSGTVADCERNKLELVLNDNPKLRTVCRRMDLLKDKEENFAKENINMPSLNNYRERILRT